MIARPGFPARGKKMRMTIDPRAAAAAAIAALCACAAAASEPTKLSAAEARGRYLVLTAGCNDCHTSGYALANGRIEESKWLTGDIVGWRGDWGTTYAPNLRLTAARLTAKEFMDLARSPLRPPMPFFNLRAMTDEDVGAIYAYLRKLGPAGAMAPAYVPPDVTPAGPFVLFPPPPPGPTP
jgi:mono/diheme cytochrome c family protein